MNDTQINTLTIAINRLTSLIEKQGHPYFPELMGFDDVAKFIGVSSKTVRAMDRRWELPTPLVIAGRKKWRRQELIHWLNAGVPGREKWRSIKPI